MKWVGKRQKKRIRYLLRVLRHFYPWEDLMKLKPYEIEEKMYELFHKEDKQIEQRIDEYLAKYETR